MASRVGALAAAALLFALCLSAPAAAQKSKLEPVSIAVIDFQGVLRSCEAAKDIRTQIDAKRAGLQQTFGETERKLRQDEQALTQQRAILSPDAFQAKAKEFKERVAGVQRDAQSRKRQLDKAFAQAMEQVRVELIKQVAELARELGVGAVLFQDQIVIAERKLDITETALKRVNQKLPKVKVVLQPLDK